MPKRFTDTEKWKKPFVRSLSCELKLIWIYILDECDVAGLWQVDWDVLQIRLGVKTTMNEAAQALKENIVILDRGEKWFIPTFIEFQYGPELSRTNNIFKSIDRILSKYDLYQYLTVEIVDEGSTVSSFRNRVSKKIRERVFLEADMTCQYCSERKSIHELVVDHLIPLNKGGDNSDMNLVCCCVRCNSHKTDIDPVVFIGSDLIFLNPTKKLLDSIKKLKGAYSPLLGTKDKEQDKDKVKVNGEGQGIPAGYEKPEMQDYEHWTNQILEQQDHGFEQMFIRERIPPGERIAELVKDHLALLNRYPKMRPENQQAFRYSCIKHIKEELRKAPPPGRQGQKLSAAELKKQLTER